MKSIGQQISLREKMYYANSFQNFIIMNNGFITGTVQFRGQLSLKETRPVPSDSRVNAKQPCIVGHPGLAGTRGRSPGLPWPGRMSCFIRFCPGSGSRPGPAQARLPAPSVFPIGRISCFCFLSEFALPLGKPVTAPAFTGEGNSSKGGHRRLSRAQRTLSDTGHTVPRRFIPGSALGV